MNFESLDDLFQEARRYAVPTGFSHDVENALKAKRASPLRGDVPSWYAEVERRYDLAGIIVEAVPADLVAHRVASSIQPYIREPVVFVMLGIESGSLLQPSSRIAAEKIAKGHRWVVSALVLRYVGELFRHLDPQAASEVQAVVFEDRISSGTGIHFSSPLVIVAGYRDALEQIVVGEADPSVVVDSMGALWRQEDGELDDVDPDERYIDHDNPGEHLVRSAKEYMKRAVRFRDSLSSGEAFQQPWQSTWEIAGAPIEHYPIRFARRQARVTATFGDDGRLEGTLVGRILHGRWVQGASSGGFRFVFDSEAQRYSGRWTEDGRRKVGTCEGHREP